MTRRWQRGVVDRPPRERKQDLDDLVELAGDGVRLAQMLGVSENTLYQWRRIGQITAPGALLVAMSAVLGQFYSAEDLRPDVVFDQWYKNPTFLRARERQTHYERTEKPHLLRIKDIIERRGRCEVTLVPKH